MRLEAPKRSLRYRVWLMVCWLRAVLGPQLGEQAGQMAGPLRYAIAVLVAAIPISFYLVQPDDLQHAIASAPALHGAPANKSRATDNSGQVGSERSEAQMSKPEESLASAESTAGTPPAAATETAMEHALKHADPTYICPMHPEITSTDAEATCPICGMDLVKLESTGESGVVALSPNVINSLGVRTAPVKRKTLYRRIDSVGYISVDENRIRTVNLRTEGWIERLVVKTVGERVEKGQLLLEVYSPKLVNAQEEYLQAKALGNRSLLQASSERLRALGVSKQQIKQLKDKNHVEQLIKVYAPQAGVISELNVREGMFVKPSTPLVNLVDLSSVWLLADVFERQADWVKVGLRADANLPYMPDKIWEGTVEYVYPSLDSKTRSLKVRLRFDNVDEQLKPNMYANVIIYAKPRRKVLTIPREALIRTGNEQRVIVAMGEGKFVPMKVQVGIETDRSVEVLGGLAEGDKVVTSSQFLIDSESSLRASLSRMGSQEK
jgi:Cu(I)/Ag(I) efflux system membrane fusion protein